MCHLYQQDKTNTQKNAPINTLSGVWEERDAQSGLSHFQVLTWLPKSRVAPSNRAVCPKAGHTEKGYRGA